LNAGANAYYAANGFIVNNHNNDTTSSGWAIVLSGGVDNSNFSQIQSADGINGGIITWGNCCGTSFYNLTSNAVNTGKTPLQIGDATHADMNINFFGGSADHASSGYQQVNVDEPAAAGPINLFGVYSEGGATSGGTPTYWSLCGAEWGINITGTTIRAASSQAEHAFYVPAACSSTNVSIYGSSENNLTGSAILDASRTPNVNIYADANGAIPAYSTKGPQSGTVTLSAGAGTFTFSPSFPSTSTVICSAIDTTSASAVKASATSTTLTLAGNGSDVIAYNCKSGGSGF
ncbi:MAG: hypothetical protein KGJ13_10305, partial [Patescibacteria group bacterium]|nr:hypothetical protein [Patescibacteria group bacterium]